MKATGFLRYWLAGIPLLLCSSLLSAESPFQLRSFDAGFQVTNYGVPLGSLTLQLTLTEGGEYLYHAHTRPERLVDWFQTDEVQETSEGVLQNSSIVPHAYEYRLGNGETRNLTRLQFDWPDQRVWTESGGTRWAQEISPGVQDKFSQQLAIRFDLANGRQQVSYQVADGGRLKRYQFRVVGREWIQTPLGRLKCLKVNRSKEGRAPDFTIWFAPSLDYLPVRIERDRFLGRYRMELKQLTLK